MSPGKNLIAHERMTSKVQVWFQSSFIQLSWSLQLMFVSILKCLKHYILLYWINSMFSKNKVTVWICRNNITFVHFWTNLIHNHSTKEQQKTQQQENISCFKWQHTFKWHVESQILLTVYTYHFICQNAIKSMFMHQCQPIQTNLLIGLKW